MFSIPCHALRRSKRKQKKNNLRATFIMQEGKTRHMQTTSFVKKKGPYGVNIAIHGLDKVRKDEMNIHKQIKSLNTIWNKQMKTTFQSEYIKVSFRSRTRVKTCCSKGCKSGKSLSDVGSVKPWNESYYAMRFRSIIEYIWI